MSRKLYPRLNRLVSETLFSSLDWKADERTLLAQSCGPVHAQATFTATGGEPVAAEDLAQIRSEIERLAAEHGYPESLDKAGFDCHCAIWLAENLEICDGEASRNQVWRHFSLVLLPHIARWRFPEPNRERVFGGIRDTFGRLHERARVFDRGPDSNKRWELLEALTEDAFVQILERPALSANCDIALALGEAWLATSIVVGQTRMEDVCRLAVKHIRETGCVLNFDAIEGETRLEQFKSVFADAAEQLGLDISPPRSVLSNRLGSPVNVTRKKSRKESPRARARSRRLSRRR